LKWLIVCAYIFPILGFEDRCDIDRLEQSTKKEALNFRFKKVNVSLMTPVYLGAGRSLIADSCACSFYEAGVYAKSLKPNSLLLESTARFATSPLRCLGHILSKGACGDKFVESK
jgi:hypothetical protein